MEKIRAALKALGIKGKISIEEVGYRRYGLWVNGEEFGIFDLDRNTFVD